MELKLILQQQVILLKAILKLATRIPTNTRQGTEKRFIKMFWLAVKFTVLEYELKNLSK